MDRETDSHLFNIGDHLPSYTNTDQDALTYFTDVLEFLSEYQWIYDFHMTKFLSKQVWKHIPEEWLEHLLNLSNEEMCQLPFDLVRDIWPESLQNFVKTAKKFSIPRCLPDGMFGITLDGPSKRGMNPKKQHEVSMMASVVEDTCKATGCQFVVDVGAGLGYLSQVLYNEYGHHILSLECEQTKAHGAQVRTDQQDIPPSGMETVTFELLDNEKSFADFQQLIQDRFSSKQLPSLQIVESGYRNLATVCMSSESTSANDKHSDGCKKCKNPSPDKYLCQTAQLGLSDLYVETPKVCLIGLHCCGSLTPTMLKLAAKMDYISALVCVGCCYHSMNITEGGCQHFPLSDQMKQCLSKSNWNVTTFALRLAAQETRARWQSQTKDDHDFHVKNVAFRSILEIMSEKDKKSIKKQKRRIARRKDYTNFDTYIEAVCDRTDVKDSLVTRAELQAIYQQHKDDFKYIEPFTLLQVIIQPVLESLLIIDRLLYIAEQGLCAVAKPIFYEFISPRNMAIIIEKIPL